MQLDFNFNKNDLENRKNGTIPNFISGFISELSSYLENLIKSQNTTYCVMSDINKEGKVYVVAQNGTGSGKNINLDELPEGVTRGTILRYKNGKMVIDEELTKESINRLNEVRVNNEKLLSEYKAEGVEYLVTEVGDDYAILQNQQTGLEFDSSDFSKDIINHLKQGLILTCENGEYVIKNN